MESPDGGSQHVATVASSFDERAAAYDESVLHRRVAEAVAEFVSLRGVTTVLDIATGTGLVLRELVARCARLRCVGIDVSPGMLGVARGALPTNSLLVRASADQLPFGDAHFDLVTCVTAMHLMAEPRAVLAEAARLLAPRGRLVLVTFRLPPGRQPVQRSYRTNHADFETVDLIDTMAAPIGLAVTRSRVGEYGGDTCLFAELSLPLPRDRSHPRAEPHG